MSYVSGLVRKVKVPEGIQVPPETETDGEHEPAELRTRVGYFSVEFRLAFLR